MQEEEEMRTRYHSFIERQRKGFEVTAAMVGYVTEKMQNAGMISNEIKISGRIKSFNSTYENTSKKAVDDCFGLRIVGPMEDLMKLEKELRKLLVIDATKDHRKKNTRYNAIHEMAHLDYRKIENSNIEPETFPEVEIQYWDKEIERQCVYGELSYAKYKSKNIANIIQRMNSGEEYQLGDLPIFYEIHGKNVTRLPQENALYKMYPEITETKGITNILNNKKAQDDANNAIEK